MGQATQLHKQPHTTQLPHLEHIAGQSQQKGGRHVDLSHALLHGVIATLEQRSPLRVCHGWNVVGWCVASARPIHTRKVC